MSSAASSCTPQHIHEIATLGEGLARPAGALHTGWPAQTACGTCNALSNAALSSKKPAANASANGSFSSVAPGPLAAYLTSMNACGCGWAGLCGRRHKRHFSSRGSRCGAHLELRREPDVYAEPIITDNLLLLPEQPAGSSGWLQRWAARC